MRKCLTRAIDEEIAQITLQYSKYGLMSVKYKFLNNETGILFLIRLRIPIFLLTLLHKRKRSSRVNFPLIITPRNLVYRTLSNGLLSMLTLKSARIYPGVFSIHLYINDFVNVSKDAELLLFADDTNVFLYDTDIYQL